ncbi:MAG: sigma 54-interacting transcriptional regulator [Thermodesulfobacteriota bacterium]|nr:sigma 54-interacting transcriptional regulator [Thermodesulfobacteriota bacterium]
MLTALAPRTEFYDVWTKFVETGATEDVPEHIRISWERCRDMGVDPLREISAVESAQKALCRPIAENLDLHHLLRSHYKDLEEKFDIAPFVILFADADGYIISIRGHEEILKMLETSTLKEGVSINECHIGTTAPGASLVDRRPVTVIAEEHYFHGFHWASCFSIPIWDHHKNILGCLDFTSTSGFSKELKSLIPHFWHTANSLQFEFFLKQKLDFLEFHDSYFRSTFEYAKEILILTNRKGCITNLNLSAQKALGTDPGSVIGKDVRGLLEINTTPSSYFHRKGIQFVRLSRLFGDSGPFSVETIPILDQKGDEIAYLLKLEQERTFVALPPIPANTAQFCFEDMIGQSTHIRHVIETAKRVAKTSSNVLIEGATGTGKELFAHAIHSASKRCDGPFVAVNSCAIPHELVESELFGYEKGAFTGAKREGNTGKFELANSGTIFLDEIHTMDKSAQMKLLRVLEDRKVTRIGGRSSVPLDVRIISATSKNLEEETVKGRFLEALFFRLNVVRLSVPSLTDCREDIYELVRHFIEELNKKLDKSVKGLAPEVMKVFSRYSWPGNVRELRNCIESAFNFCDGEIINIEHLPGSILSKTLEAAPEGQGLDHVTRRLFIESLNRFGNVKKAALHLGIPRSTFYRKMKKFGLSI